MSDEELILKTRDDLNDALNACRRSIMQRSSNSLDSGHIGVILGRLLGHAESLLGEILEHIDPQEEGGERDG